MSDAAISYGARLRAIAQMRPSQVAVVFVPQAGPAQTLTWAEMDGLCNRYAHTLVALGVRRGSIVGFALGNGPAHLVLALAIWRLGATTLVMDPALSPQLAAQMKARSGAALIIAEGAGVGDVTLAAFAQRAAGQPDTPVPDQISLPGKIVLSGGSTGLPKMMADARPFVRVPGQSWGRVAPRLGFRTDQVQLVCAAMSHNAPFTWAQNGLFEGNQLVLMERFDAGRALQVIAQHQVGFVMLVPTMMVRMLDALPGSGVSLSSLHALYHTGAPCADWLKAAWIAQLGAERVFEMYGSGENTGQTVISGTEWLTHRGSVGRGFETDIRIYGPEGRVAAGQSGEIFMRPDDLAGRSEYLGSDAPQPLRDREGYQSIGDTGWLDAEGYLYLGGRRDDVINTGGVKIHPEAIEARLLQHPDILDAVAFGVEDREWGQKLVACVVLRAGVLPVAAPYIAFCARDLGPAQTPKAILFRESLPRDGFGKIKRKALAAALG
ncbi:AMP-binding protein [Phaeovulum sp. W22_SRMD_FR3]|uniref:AMP-binding protein n=1 Tax=Phaeovulum sp. W22_SRMD_FR3 TaxID=3240274 RepID=UPI003F9B8AA9